MTWNGLFVWFVYSQWLQCQCHTTLDSPPPLHCVVFGAIQWDWGCKALTIDYYIYRKQHLTYTLRKIIAYSPSAIIYPVYTCTFAQDHRPPK